MVTSLELAPLIPLLPIAGFPLILLVGQFARGQEWWKNGLKEGGLIALAVLGISVLLSTWLLVDNIGVMQGGIDQEVGDWLTFDTNHQDANGEWSLTADESVLGIGVWVDHVSILLAFTASFLSFLITWFSIGYMNKDKVNENRLHRFYAELLLFSSGMLGMVLADSFLWLFIFWEIMGLCSYLLIGFYWERPSAASAAKKAFLVTRIGDVFLLIGLIILFNTYGTLAFSEIFNNAGEGELALVRLAMFFLFIGAVGKSAQFPLHVWLPDAMEGPTPVSALIHAATMVNAGLYLVARMWAFFAADAFIGGLSSVAITIGIIGGISAIMAAGIAFVQKDIKRVLAYSTMSQLAYIFIGLGSALWLVNNNLPELGLFAFGASLFHLFNHAMAKGMLFMASGSVIHEMHEGHHHLASEEREEDDSDGFDAQSMDYMGGLASRLPVTATAMAIGSASIIGIPLIGGFWSKEGIIGSVWKAANYEGGLWFIIPGIFAILTAGMTGFYMTRMWMMTFAGKPKSNAAGQVTEKTPWIKTPLVTLSIISLFGGIILAALEVNNWISAGHSLHLHLAELGHAFLPDGPINILMAWVTIFLALVIGPLYAMKLYGGYTDRDDEIPSTISWLIPLSARFEGSFDNSSLRNSKLATWLESKLYFDDWYDAFSEKFIAEAAKGSAILDESGVDGVVKGVERGSMIWSRLIRRMTTGRGRDYVMMVAFGAAAIAIFIWQGVV